MGSTNPVFLLPGQAPSSVTLALGYGRTAAGQVGNGVGVDAYVLRTSAAPHVLPSVSVRATGRSYPLATTQDHHVVDLAAAWSRTNVEPRLYREAVRRRWPVRFFEPPEKRAD